MKREEAITILRESLDGLGEYFDAVQIHATWMDSGNETLAVHQGSGNFYAREAMAREFVRHNESDDQAQFIAKEMKREERMKLSEERILQISNDIAEGINNRVTVAELKACVTYWQDRAVTNAAAIAYGSVKRLEEELLSALHP